MKRILIAGLGNVFHGDDAFGVEVVRELLTRSQPAGVTIKDFGIRAYDLAYALTDDYDAIVLVDAAPRGQAPGTVWLIEPELSRLAEFDADAVDPHAMNPLAVLKLARSIGGVSAKLFLVGCEPAVLECDEGELGLSKPVQAAVPAAIAMIESLSSSLLNEAEFITAGPVPA